MPLGRASALASSHLAWALASAWGFPSDSPRELAWTSALPLASAWLSSSGRALAVRWAPAWAAALQCGFPVVVSPAVGPAAARKESILVLRLGWDEALAPPHAIPMREAPGRGWYQACRVSGVHRLLAPADGIPGRSQCPKSSPGACSRPDGRHRRFLPTGGQVSPRADPPSSPLQ